MASDTSRPEDTSFLSQIERVRIELREKVARAHQVLYEREAELLSELQQLEGTDRGEGIAEQIKELSLTKDQMIATLKGNENQLILQQSIAPLNARIKELQAKLDTAGTQMRQVTLEWDSGLEGTLAGTGSILVRDAPAYRTKGVPIAVAGKHSLSSKETENFLYPRAVSIDPESEDIFICDFGNDRVQVYSKSLAFIRSLSDGMQQPFGVCAHAGRVYVTQLATHSLTVHTAQGAFVQRVGRKGAGELEFCRPGGVAVSAESGRIYVCEFDNNRVQCLNSNLSFHSYISDVLFPQDIKLSPLHIVVLRGRYPKILFYDFAYKLIKEILTEEKRLVNSSWHFCLDKHCNILLTDTSASCVVIVSSSGELIHKFGNAGEGKGEFFDLTGIAVSSESNIIVVSQNASHTIQLF